MKRLLTALVLLCVACAAAASGVDASRNAAHPLLQLARERERTRDKTPRVAPGTAELKEALHQLEQAQVPADKECARAIGAARYAGLYVDLAGARSAEGDYRGAADEFRKAHACRPHDADILTALAGSLFDAHDYGAARDAINSALAIDARDISVNRLAGNLDYIEEHWADAIARFRYVAASDPDRIQAGYGQLMYWLAQRRAGIARPEFVARTPGEGWPQPLLLHMRGQYSEAELIAPIKDGDSDSNTQPNTSTDERLCETLFYVGEEYWARGQPDVARDYLAALVNIKVLYFVEHGIALAEIRKLR